MASTDQNNTSSVEIKFKNNAKEADDMGHLVIRDRFKKLLAKQHPTVDDNRELATLVAKNDVNTYVSQDDLAIIGERLDALNKTEETLCSQLRSHQEQLEQAFDELFAYLTKRKSQFGIEDKDSEEYNTLMAKFERASQAREACYQTYDRNQIKRTLSELAKDKTFSGNYFLPFFAPRELKIVKRALGNADNDNQNQIRLSHQEKERREKRAKRLHQQERTENQVYDGKTPYVAAKPKQSGIVSDNTVGVSKQPKTRRSTNNSVYKNLDSDFAAVDTTSSGRIIDHKQSAQNCIKKRAESQALLKRIALVEELFADVENYLNGKMNSVFSTRRDIRILKGKLSLVRELKHSVSSGQFSCSTEITTKIDELAERNALKEQRATISAFKTAQSETVKCLKSINTKLVTKQKAYMAFYQEKTQNRSNIASPDKMSATS